MRRCCCQILHVIEFIVLFSAWCSCSSACAASVPLLRNGNSSLRPTRLFLAELHQLSQMHTAPSVAGDPCAALHQLDPHLNLHLVRLSMRNGHGSRMGVRRGEMGLYKPASLRTLERRSFQYHPQTSSSTISFFPLSSSFQSYFLSCRRRFPYCLGLGFS